MEKGRGKDPVSKSKILRIAGLIVLCSVGVFLNLGAGWFAGRAGLPLYLDTLGTVLIAAVGGYIPAIFVGFFTNLIKSIYDTTAVYFGCINVLSAILVGYLSKQGWMKKWYKAFTIGLLMAVSSGILGSILSYCLYGFAADDVSADLTLRIYESTGMPQYPAQLLANLALEFCDKVLTVTVVFFLRLGIPESIKENTMFDGWQQTPLSKKTLNRIRKMSSKRMGIRSKISLILILSLFSVSLGATLISYYLYRQNTIEEHKHLAGSVADLAVGLIDPEKVNEYIINGRQVPGYEEIEQRLYQLRDSSDEIEFIYVYRIELDGCHVVFDLSTDDYPAAKPGEVLSIEEAFVPLLGDMILGEQIDPLVTNDQYGFLLTVYKPVYNKAGNCTCYVGVDVSMTKLAHNSYIFFAKLLSIFLSFFLLTMSFCLWLAEYNILIPVNTMTYAAGIMSKEEGMSSDEADEVKNLDIRTGDEIELLYRALAKSSEKSLKQFDTLSQRFSHVLSSRRKLIFLFADMIESRESDTGGHVDRLVKSVKVILRSMRELGYYQDIVTDQFVEDVISAVPLHDIGKVNVSEIVLNKPGKLTDEEFAIMKMHTRYGSEIIDGILQEVPDSGMLQEAKNIAAYHHERWDGKGYPEGLKGEDIPLSARVVAVADLFDELMTKRGHDGKEPLSFEDAMDVMNDESGTGFDPLVAEAFIMAEDEIRKIYSDKAP